MRPKVTLVLIFLNVALFFFIFKFERTWRTEAASREAKRRVLGPEAANIRSLEVTSAAPAGSFGMERERDTWFLTKPLDRWPANSHAVSGILHGLELLEHETSFAVADLSKNNQTLADFGLLKPKLTVAFSSGDPAIPAGAALPPTRLHIGDSTPDGKRLYILSPDGARIHVVNRSLADSWPCRWNTSDPTPAGGARFRGAFAQRAAGGRGRGSRRRRGAGADPA